MRGLSFTVELWLPDTVSDEEAEATVMAHVKAGLIEAVLHASQADKAQCGYAVERNRPSVQ